MYNENSTREDFITFSNLPLAENAVFVVLNTHCFAPVKYVNFPNNTHTKKSASIISSVQVCHSIRKNRIFSYYPCFVSTATTPHKPCSPLSIVFLFFFS